MNLLNKLKLGVLSFFVFMGLATNFQVLASPAGDNIVISEVLYNPSGTEPNGEWFELFNPTAAAIDISNWTITDLEGTVTIPVGTVIASGDYYVAAHTAPTASADYYYGPITGNTFFLANGGDELIVSDATATQVDMVSWGGPANMRFNIVAGSDLTIARQSSTDTDLEGDWLSNQTPTPGTGNLVSQSPSIEAIPTLSQWSLFLLALLLGFISYRQGLLRKI